VSGNRDKVACTIQLTISLHTFLFPHPSTAIKNRFHHLRRRILKDVSKGSRFLSSVPDLHRTVIIGRVRATHPHECTDGETELTNKIHSILPYLASLSNTESGPPPTHFYTFGPFREPSSGGEQCKRCLLFAPSAQTGTHMCTATGYCEACTRIPTYVSCDMLRECLNLRKCPDGRSEIIEEWSSQVGCPF